LLSYQHAGAGPDNDYLISTLVLDMLDSRGIVAPGALLYRSPDAAPTPLYVREACHYSLYQQRVRIGSISTCHPLGPVRDYL
jgi:hypothetical protein